MNLTDRQVQVLVNLLSLTKDEETDCNNCLQQMAEFAETKLSGKPISDGLKQVEEHLERCDDCREEFEALKTALEGELPAS